MIATEGKAFDQATLLHMAKRIGARITTVPGSHAVFITQARVVADTLQQAAHEASQAAVAATVTIPTKEFTMSALTLPDPIAAYFAADARGADDVARCFTPQGVVKDKGQTHTGPNAIKAWKVESSTLYTYTNDPFSVELVDGVHVVYSHTAGTFPGSPIDLKLSFRLEGGHIASLEITA